MLRNKTINPEQGKPSGTFLKESNKTSKPITKPSKTQGENTKLIKEKELQVSRIQKGDKDEMVDTSILPTTTSFDIANTLAQMKVSVPLLEMMKFLEYREKTLKVINGVSKEETKEHKQNSQNNDNPILTIYLGSTITKNPSQVDPFYLTLMINNKMIKNCMIESRAAINVMPVGVMKELGMSVDTNFGKCYAMDNRSVPVVGVMKDVEFKLGACPKASYKTYITVVDVPPNYGMLLSRQWSILIGGHVQLDLSYATIPVNGQEVRIEREPRSEYIIEEVEPIDLIFFIQSDMDNFKVELTKTKLRGLTPIESTVKKSKDQVWKMYFEGSCNKEGSGVGIVFISPDGETFK